MIINASFDSSVTSLSNAATIEAAFNTAAAIYMSTFSNPVTVNVKVGWGEVGGTTLASNAAGGSQTGLTGYWTYAQMRSILASSVALPATNTGPAYFAMATAEAKALGLISATATASDGAVGFNSGLTYDFNPSDGITAGSYDFVGLALHELAEVLGRDTSITSIASLFYQTPVDLFRYKAAGVQSYGYNDAAYFSLDAGKTNLGWFDNTSGGGDRSDWRTGSTGSYPNDVQNAYYYPGATTLSPADIALLGALGWNSTNSKTSATSGSTGTTSGSAVVGDDDDDDVDTTAVPEPSALMILAFGLTGLASLRRPRVGA